MPMTKAEFVAKYRNIITVYFSFEELINNPDITIKESDRHLSEFLEFYSPRYTKNGRWDDRHISQIAQDKTSTITQLKDIVPSPANWGFQTFENARELAESLWPVPLATQELSGKTLILDSNHTICTLLKAGLNVRVPCVQLSGANISELGIDLRLMQP